MDFSALVIASEYDRDARRLRSFEQPSGNSASVASQLSYNADGETLSAKDRKQIADVSLGSTTFGYDALGRQTSRTEATGTTTEARTESGYDGLDRDAGQTFVLGRSPRASRGAAALESHSRSTNGSRHAGASKGAPK